MCVPNFLSKYKNVKPIQHMRVGLSFLTFVALLMSFSSFSHFRSRLFSFHPFPSFSLLFYLCCDAARLKSARWSERVQ